MLLTLFLLLSIILAILSLQTNSLRNAIIYAGVFSLICSLCYLLYQAPDVAIAEAVIGCTMSTILFLVALKKYKIYRVYYQAYPSKEINPNKEELLKHLSGFCVGTELELDLIYSNKSVKAIMEHKSYDLIIEETKDHFIIHGDNSNYHYEQLVLHLATHSTFEWIYQPIENN